MSVLHQDPEENSNQPRGFRADALSPDQVVPHAARFAKYFEVADDEVCWPWIGATHQSGYGVFGIDRKIRYAPRIAWVLASGVLLPQNISIDHLCNNRICVNPKHLEPVSIGENTRRRNQRRGWAVGEDEALQRQRERSLAWYYRNREKVLADMRAKRAQRRGEAS